MLLEAHDGTRIYLANERAKVSGLLQMFLDVDENDVAPLPLVTGDELKLIVRFCELYRPATPESIAQEANDNPPQPANHEVHSFDRSEYLRVWYPLVNAPFESLVGDEYANLTGSLDDSVLRSLEEKANYMLLPPLAELVQITRAYNAKDPDDKDVKDMTEEEMRKLRSMCGIDTPLSMEEYRAIIDKYCVFNV